MRSICKANCDATNARKFPSSRRKRRLMHKLKCTIAPDLALFQSHRKPKKSIDEKYEQRDQGRARVRKVLDEAFLPCCRWKLNFHRCCCCCWGILGPLAHARSAAKFCPQLKSVKNEHISCRFDIQHKAASNYVLLANFCASK